MSAANRGGVRRVADFYPTPLSAFVPLLKHLPRGRVYFEPACGDGRLVTTLNANGFNADGSDLIHGYDFLRDSEKRDVILTNPPFSLAFEFVKKAVCDAETVYMLLRLNFLASRKRRAWFQAHEPSAVFVLSERPSFTGKGTDATDYAWIGWRTGQRGIFHL